MSWRDHAACHGTRDDRIWPSQQSDSSSTRTTKERIRRERSAFRAQYCDRCPVTQECYDYAIKVNEGRNPYTYSIQAGMWGGKDFTYSSGGSGYVTIDEWLDATGQKKRGGT